LILGVPFSLVTVKHKEPICLKLVLLISVIRNSGRGLAFSFRAPHQRTSSTHGGCRGKLPDIVQELAMVFPRYDGSMPPSSSEFIGVVATFSLAMAQHKKPIRLKFVLLISIRTSGRGLAFSFRVPHQRTFSTQGRKSSRSSMWCSACVAIQSEADLGWRGH
jgi:hypothetical protein